MIMVRCTGRRSLCCSGAQGRRQILLCKLQGQRHVFGLLQQAHLSFLTASSQCSARADTSSADLASCSSHTKVICLDINSMPNMQSCHQCSCIHMRRCCLEYNPAKRCRSRVAHLKLLQQLVRLEDALLASHAADIDDAAALVQQWQQRFTHRLCAVVICIHRLLRLFCPKYAALVCQACISTNHSPQSGAVSLAAQCLCRKGHTCRADCICLLLSSSCALTALSTATPWLPPARTKQLRGKQGCRHAAVNVSNMTAVSL